MTQTDALARAIDRFVAKVEPMMDDRGCWEWTGAKKNDRYGGFNLSGRKHGRIEKASRVAWKLFRGDLKPTDHVLHRCDNTNCVNPGHLFLGDHTANMLDMADKKRGNAGLTACRRGHPFTPENTYESTRNRNGRKRRHCKTCQKLRRVNYSTGEEVSA